MQGLVYIFIGLCGAALGIAVYFVPGLTPIESVLFGIVVFLGGVLFEERLARRRAHKRLEKGVEEMGRLLATDAKAGQVLSQRVNALADLDLGPRLEVIEADMSVLGTVVRQVAEAVSDLENAQVTHKGAEPDRTGGPTAQSRRQEPSVSIDAVRRALDDGRLIHHAQPIFTLPQRKLNALDMVPRLEIDAKLVDPPDYMPMPTREGEIVIRRIERICAEEGLRIVRRARLNGNPVRLLVDFSRASLSDRKTIDELLTLLAANRAVTPDLAFALDYEDWTDLGRVETDALATLVQQGAGLALRNATTLRLDFAALADKGVRYITVAGEKFLKTPAALTDFHPSDINDYIKRFGVNLIVTEITAESEVLALLDDGVRLAQGRLLGATGPLREDLRDDGDDDLRKLAAR